MAFKLCEGWLDHKTFRTHGQSYYERLWVVLKGNVIYLFKDGQTTADNQVGCLTIDSRSKFQIQRGDHNRGFKFDLLTGTHRNRFKTPKSSERELWRGYFVGISTRTVPKDLDLLDSEIRAIEDGIQRYVGSAEGRQPSIHSVKSKDPDRDSGRESIYPDDNSSRRSRFSTPSVGSSGSSGSGTVIFNGGPIMKHNFGPGYKEPPSWFFSKCSRESAQRILEAGCQYGNTLIRESTSYIQNGSYVISKRTWDEMSRRHFFEHFEVIRTAGGYKVDVENPHSEMKNLTQVVSYFVKTCPEVKLMQTNDLETLGLKTPDYQTRIDMKEGQPWKWPPPGRTVTDTDDDVFAHEYGNCSPTLNRREETREFTGHEYGNCTPPTSQWEEPDDVTGHEYGNCSPTTPQWKDYDQSEPERSGRRPDWNQSGAHTVRPRQVVTFEHGRSSNPTNTYHGPAPSRRAHPSSRDLEDRFETEEHIRGLDDAIAQFDHDHIYANEEELSPALDPHDPMNTPAADKLIEMGYSHDKIRQVVLAVRRKSGRISVSSEQALAYLLETEDKTKSAPAFKSTKTPHRDTETPPPPPHSMADNAYYNVNDQERTLPLPPPNIPFAEEQSLGPPLSVAPPPPRVPTGTAAVPPTDTPRTLPKPVRHSVSSPGMIKTQATNTTQNVSPNAQTNSAVTPAAQKRETFTNPSPTGKPASFPTWDSQSSGYADGASSVEVKAGIDDKTAGKVGDIRFRFEQATSLTTRAADRPMVKRGGGAVNMRANRNSTPALLPGSSTSGRQQPEASDGSNDDDTKTRNAISFYLPDANGKSSASTSWQQRQRSTPSSNLTTKANVVDATRTSLHTNSTNSNTKPSVLTATPVEDDDDIYDDTAVPTNEELNNQSGDLKKVQFSSHDDTINAPGHQGDDQHPAGCAVNRRRRETEPALSISDMERRGLTQRFKEQLESTLFPTGQSQGPAKVRSSIPAPEEDDYQILPDEVTYVNDQFNNP